MATIGEILDKCAQAGLSVEGVNDLDIVFVSPDGDDVSFTIKGYDEGEDQFVIMVDDIDVPSSAKSSGPTEQITVTVPEGVEVIVTRQGVDANAE